MNKNSILRKLTTKIGTKMRQARRRNDTEVKALYEHMKQLHNLVDEADLNIHAAEEVSWDVKFQNFLSYTATGRRTNVKMREVVKLHREERNVDKEIDAI